MLAVLVGAGLNVLSHFLVLTQDIVLLRVGEGQWLVFISLVGCNLYHRVQLGSFLHDGIVNTVVNDGPTAIFIGWA